MKLEKIWAVYFSGTGTTRRTVERIAGGIASRLNLPAESVDFSRPAVRQETLRFGEKDLVVFGAPVYAGRVPNVLLPFLQERIVGGGALAVPVVLFGNRDYDDALIELRNILAADGMHPIAAGAFVGEHSFSRVLGADRPNAEDEALMDEFAARVAELAAGLDAAPVKSVAVRGQEPLRPYYTPRDRAGNPINILKVKPKRICPAVAAVAYVPIYAPWAPSTRRMCRRSGASASSAAPASRAAPPAPSFLTMRGISTTSMSWRRSMPARRKTKCSTYNYDI